MTAPSFEFRDVSKWYRTADSLFVPRQPVPALARVSFAIAEGRHTVLLGPSGCGKSTVLSLLAGLETPSLGEILGDGRTISLSERVILSPHRRGVSMVFQDLALWRDLTALGNVLLGLSGARLSRSERHRRAAEALALCGIGELANRKPGLLSGGEQQRVALARAIAVRPRFLLLDEPFAGLDLATKTALLGEIADLASAQRLTVILVTHDPLEAVGLCRFALILEGGRLVQSGELEEVLREPRSSLLEIFRQH